MKDSGFVIPEKWSYGSEMGMCSEKPETNRKIWERGK